MAGFAASPSRSWLGADVGDLDTLAARCGQAGEAADRVGRSLRAEVLEQEWASGPFFHAYREFVASHLVPTLATLAEALHRFGRVASGHADAQRRVSAGESADLAAMPQYESPLAARSGRGKAPSGVDSQPDTAWFGPLLEIRGRDAEQDGSATLTTEWYLRAVGLDADPGSLLTGDVSGLSDFLSTSEFSDKANMKAYLVDGSHMQRSEEGGAYLETEVFGSVSLDASAAASIDQYRISGEAEVFAGGRAGLRADLAAGGVSLALRGEGWLGFGAARGFEFGTRPDGSFTIGASIGGAWWWGGKVSWRVAVNPDEVSETFSRTAESVGETADRAWDWLSSGWDTKPRSR